MVLVRCCGEDGNEQQAERRGFNWTQQSERGRDPRSKNSYLLSVYLPLASASPELQPRQRLSLWKSKNRKDKRCSKEGTVPSPALMLSLFEQNLVLQKKSNFTGEVFINLKCGLCCFGP